MKRPKALMVSRRTQTVVCWLKETFFRGSLVNGWMITLRLSFSVEKKNWLVTVFVLSLVWNDTIDFICRQNRMETWIGSQVKIEPRSKIKKDRDFVRSFFELVCPIESMVKAYRDELIWDWKSCFANWLKKTSGCLTEENMFLSLTMFSIWKMFSSRLVSISN